MVDPLTPGVAAAERVASRVVDRVLRDRERRRALLRQSGITHLERPARKVAEGWLDSPGTVRQLLAEEPRLQQAARLDLEQRLEADGIAVPSALDAIVSGAREALLDARPPAQAVREESASLAGVVRDGIASLSELLHADPPNEGRPLPPPVQSCLRRVNGEQLQRQLHEFLAAPPTQAALRRQLTDDSLLSLGGPAAWEAAALVAEDQGHSEVAAALWEQLTLQSPDPVRALARQALALAAVNLTGARELLKTEAARGDLPPFATAVQGTLEEDHARVAALASELDPTDVEYVLTGMLVVQALCLQDRFAEGIELAETLASEDDSADAVVIHPGCDGGS